ncbi:MAG: acyl-ACP--UDP-N-acetylglucosamine O-acyltransferase [Planctomycetota bacterium]
MNDEQPATLAPKFGDGPEVHPLSVVDPAATLGRNVKVGPFCTVGPDVVVGDGTVLDSHVVLTGRVTVGANNRFWPGVVIGGEPQDKSWQDGPTAVEIGDDNQFREGVTVHRGAEKEDGVTRIGSRCLLMANAHVAHNCHVFDDVTLVNGVLLGGHVHVHERAIISGNTVVHHFTSIGTLGFVSGGCRVVRDLPPYMLAAGNDQPQVRSINVVGMRRLGVTEPTIRLVRKGYKLLFRECLAIGEVRSRLLDGLDVIPTEVATLLDFVEKRQGSKSGRGREVHVARDAAKDQLKRDQRAA